jgi:2-polyprenyl-6-methoxyphenol hydroxylase-like FAD-dependent oxidoreductase
LKGKKVCVVGAGWAGLAAAVGATQGGHRVTVLEASRSLGGRARALAPEVTHGLPDGSTPSLDNGQHILVGGYRETLTLMRVVGLDPADLLLRLPLTLQFPDGSGLRLPDWPPPWNQLAGVLAARGWSLGDKWSLLAALRRWKRAHFQCSASATVAELCVGLRPQVMDSFIEPLCISALNTPAQQASGQVFLTVLHDTLKPVLPHKVPDDGAPDPAGERPWAGSDLLLPRADLSALFPNAAARWLQARGVALHLGERASAPRWVAGQWQVGEERFDAVVWATAPAHAVQALAAYAPEAPKNVGIYLQRWLRLAEKLKHAAIATVYAHAEGLALPVPMLALTSSPQVPAQFVFDRGQLGGPPGLLAFVVSAAQGSHETLEEQVLAQGHQQLEHLLGGQRLVAVQTVVEKRATLACTPRLARPPQRIAPGLLACGDYLYAPYPSTLEGAVRSGLMAALALDESDGFAWKP